jgi:hypothetical protein
MSLNLRPIIHLYIARVMYETSYQNAFLDKFLFILIEKSKCIFFKKLITLDQSYIYIYILC